MLKRGKKAILSVLLAAMILSTYIVASAAEPSERVVEGSRHSVYAFGKSVVLIVEDTIEIVPNNDTKMIDVMIDGKVFTGLGSLKMQTTEDNKVIPEEGSIILQCDSQEQVQELKDKVAAGLENNTPVESIAELVEGQENTAAFMIDESGNLVDNNGKAVTDSAAPKVEIKSISEAYEEVVEEQQEKQEEMRQQEERERQAAIEASQEEDKDVRVDKIIVAPATNIPASAAPESFVPVSVEPSVAPSAETTDAPAPPSIGAGQAAAGTE